MEFYPAPEEFTPPPEEYRVPVEPADRSDEEFSPRPCASRPSGNSRHSRLKRLMLVPLAAAVASASLWMASFGYDPLGTDAPDGDTKTDQQGEQTEEGISDYNDAFPVLPNLDPDFAGDYAWGNEGPEEYVRIVPEGSQEFVYLHMGEAWKQIEGRGEGILSGASYDSETNTLTLENFNGAVLDVNLMGNGFTIRLIGENRLQRLTVWGAGYGGSVTFAGEGSLVINGGSEPAILLNAEGSQSCLMVENGVTVEARSGRASVVVLDTAMDQGVYWRSGVTVTGGEPAAVDQEKIDGTTYYTHAMVDENGNLATYVRFGAE